MGTHVETVHRTAPERCRERAHNEARDLLKTKMFSRRRATEIQEYSKMDFEELVNTRKSVRGFKSQPVPRAVIEEIIEVAKRAPSSMNTQPWHVHVLTGEPLEQSCAGATWKR